MRQILILLVGAMAAISMKAARAEAHELEIDTSAARAVLEALANPNLTNEEARRIATMPANQQMIRKVAANGNGADQEMFEAELLSVAKGQLPAKEQFSFSRVKNDLPKVIATLADFEQNKDSNARWILNRVDGFSPPGPALKLKGWIIAGGSATGFAFGGPEFYLRISDFAEAPDYLRAVMAHELYHAVQGAARTRLQKQDNFDTQAWRAMPLGPRRDAYAVNALLLSLLGEGIATYVGDPASTASNSRLAANERDRIRAAARLPNRLPTLLDMTLLSVIGEEALDPENVYSVGFYADQPLYYLGYLMAKAIAESEGNARLGELSLGDGCGFANDYLALSAADVSLPRLGARSIAIIHQSCPTE